jgi:phosphoglycolate phosphatase
MVERLFGDRFAAVLGHSEAHPKKPDPAMLLAAAAALGAAPTRCVYVGDTAVDVEAALAAGMLPVGVSWGFRPHELHRAVHVLRRPDELLGLVEVLDMTQR